MGITLTLTELKKYFETWHNSDNLFDDLHRRKVEGYINDFLQNPTNNIMLKINLIEDLKTNILTIGDFILKMVDGTSAINPNSSSINDISTALTNKINKLNNLNLEKLANNIENNAINIEKKADKTEVDRRFSDLSANLGIEPKNIQIQDIPSGANLNSYNEISGIYKSISSSISTTITNRPENIEVGFDLIVIHNKNSEINNTVTVKQLILTSGAGKDGNRIYSRNYLTATNTWSDWIEFYGTHNLSVVQMEVEFSNKDKVTYNLLQK